MSVLAEVAPWVSAE